MTLHLIKLCVGVSEIAELKSWQDKCRARGQALQHVTRMMPKEKEALLDGGSLYWVIGGLIRVRQRLMDIKAFRDKHGISRCRLILDPALVPTYLQPRRAFQGWRYLDPKDAPQDLKGQKKAGLPEEMQAELAKLGLL